MIIATGITCRNLKVLLSIGGWSYRDNFVPLGKDAGKREMFAKSGVRLVEDLGLDG
jgi:chitinase